MQNLKRESTGNGTDKTRRAGGLLAAEFKTGINREWNGTPLP